jgi:hypothetical protein
MRSARDRAGGRPDRLLRQLLDRESALGLPPGPVDEEVVTEDALAGLPEPARRYLRFMAVVGRPRVGAFRARFEGRFRLRQDRPWMGSRAWQYNSRVGPTRLYRMRLDIAGLLPMTGWDTYVDGRGRMRGRVLGVLPVADAEGDEMDLGELVTYLDDALLLAPSMLLGPETAWHPVDGASFDVDLTDRGRTVRARVVVDGRGAPTDISTGDRTAMLPGGPVRARWSTPVEAWTVIDGRPRPTGASAVWHLPDGPYTYARGTFRIVSHDPPAIIPEG